MPVIHLMLILAFIGFGLWAINTYIPMAEPIKKILNGAVIVGTCIFLLVVFGLWSDITTIRIGHQ